MTQVGGLDYPPRIACGRTLKRKVHPGPVLFDVETVRRAAGTILDRHPQVAYALLFGSVARGEQHRRRVQLVVLSGASLALRIRVFRDGVLLSEKDSPRRVTEQARAIVEYLDFRPIEQACEQGVLRARRSGGTSGRRSPRPRRRDHSPG